MLIQVLKKFSIKEHGEICHLHPGIVFDIEENRAVKLLEAGVVAIAASTILLDDELRTKGNVTHLGQGRTAKREKTMDIPIKAGDKTLHITSDINQYIIAEEKTRDGKTVIEGRWFFQNLGALCTKLLHLKVRSSDARTLEELMDVTYRAEHEIMAALDFDKMGDAMAEKAILKMGGSSQS